MCFKYNILFLIIIFIVILSDVSTSPTKDLILGRNYVPQAEAPSATFNLIRLSDSSNSVQQILQLIFAPIQSVIGTILNLICSLIEPITAVIEAFRISTLVPIIILLQTLYPLISVLFPQYAAVTLITEYVLNITNGLLSNATTIANTYGCTIISSINIVIADIFVSILGIF